MDDLVVCPSQKRRHYQKQGYSPDEESRQLLDHGRIGKTMIPVHLKVS